MSKFIFSYIFVKKLPVLKAAWTFENTITDLVNGISFSSLSPVYESGANAFDGVSLFLNSNGIYYGTDTSNNLAYNFSQDIDMSICFWFKKSSSSGFNYHRYIEFNSNGFQIFLDENGSSSAYRFRYNDNTGNQIQAFSSVNCTNWTMGTITVEKINSNQAQLRCFLNTTEVSSPLINLPAYNSQGNGNIIFRSDTGTYYDNMYCWIGRLLSPSDISNLYNSGSGRNYAWVTANLP